MTFLQGRNQNLDHIFTLLEKFYEKYGPLSTIKYGTVFKKITIHQEIYVLVIILIISFVMFIYLYVLCIINRRNFQEYIVVLHQYTILFRK